MESAAVMRSFHCAVGTVAQVNSLVEKPTVVPMYMAASKARRGTYLRCIKASESTLAAKSDGVALKSCSQGPLEKKKRAATFPKGFEALVLEVCDETEVAELKLKVSVPGTILFNVVTVRCGHCANLLSVNMASLLQTLPTNATPTTPPHQDNHLHHNHQYSQNHQHLSLDGDSCRNKEFGSSSKCNKASMQLAASTHINEEPPTPPRMLPIRPPEKRQRVPSAYNRFIKEEIQRIKANNPDISHREAFSTAAKNWAHFPHIHFGLSVDGNKQVKMDAAFAGEAGMQKTQDFY